MKSVRDQAPTPTLARRDALRWLGLGWTAFPMAAPPAQAVDGRWPARRIRLLVAYPPGGVSDRVARLLAEQLSSQLAVAVFVENRPGASGSIAMDVLMRSPPDGYTLGFAAATAVGEASRARAETEPTRSPSCREPVTPDTAEAMSARGRSTAPQDAHPVQRLTPVAGVMTTPVLIAGTSALKAIDFAGMLALARQTPDALRWATTGEGTTGHAVMEQVSHLAGIRVVHIPYKGGGQQIADAIGGHFDLVSTNVAQPQLRAVEAGQLRALAVGAPQRVAALPQTPTLAELGFAPANLDSLFGLFAPPRTPPEIVRRIHAAVHRALMTAPLADSLAAMSNQAFTGSTRDFEVEIQLRGGRLPRC